MTRKSADPLSLRFYEPAKPGAHTVPAAALAQSLDALQRVIHLLAMRQEGRAPGRRIRPSAELQARYQLVCELPGPGSFVAPVHIAGAGLLSTTEIPAVMGELSKVLAAVGKTSEADLEETIEIGRAHV